MTDESNKPKRAWSHPSPIDIEPVLIKRGHYLSITDYARQAGVTRLTAYNQMRRGEIDTVRVGVKTVLVKIKK
jgi:hypothetical protein